MEVNSETLLIIKLPESKFWYVVSRLVFLALFIFIVTLFCTGSIFRGPSVLEELDTESETFEFQQLGLLLNDLAGEGLLRKGDKAIIVNSANAGMVQNVHHLDNNKIHVELNLVRKSSFLDESLDFVWTSYLVDAKFVDHIVKIGGIVALPLSSVPENGFRENPNYRIVYRRPYSSIIIVGMRKTGSVDELGRDCLTKRRLCQLATEAKKSALKGLEDVLLEPPRTMPKSSKYLKKIKFLPDLLGDSLDDYRRLMFINVGSKREVRGLIDLFRQNYLKVNQEFRIYNLEVEVVPEEEPSIPVASQQSDVSDCLVENVGEEEYVVMKAEAEVVEVMIKKGTICLVDELFLECNNQWWQTGRRKQYWSRKAYWECLALYGRLRDVGVAVHQWWG